MSLRSSPSLPTSSHWPWLPAFTPRTRSSVGKKVERGTLPCHGGILPFSLSPHLSNGSRFVRQLYLPIPALRLLWLFKFYSRLPKEILMIIPSQICFNFFSWNYLKLIEICKYDIKGFFFFFSLWFESKLPTCCLPPLIFLQIRTFFYKVRWNHENQKSNSNTLLPSSPQTPFKGPKNVLQKEPEEIACYI